MTRTSFFSDLKYVDIKKRIGSSNILEKNENDNDESTLEDLLLEFD